MSMTNLTRNNKSAQVSLVSCGRKKTVDLYSPEGLELLSRLWLKAYVQARLTHDLSWMGIPIIQFPEDICMMQELIWKVRPDIIIECGVAHGGSLVFYASLLELLGRGQVIGVDVEIRHYNRVAITNHPMAPRITLIEGSSISREVVARIKKRIRNAKKVMVVLDSNHSAKHVAQELKLYSELVTPGSYLVAMDGAQGYVWDIPSGKAEWKRDNPLTAIEQFLSRDKRFAADDHYTRLKVTANPKGFLRRLTREEMVAMKGRGK